MAVKPIGYKNCYYDSFEKCIYLKEIGDIDYKKYPYTHWYYSYDPKQQSEIKDIFGKSVVRHNTNNRKEIERLKQHGAKFSESDFTEVVKFLHDRYDKVAEQLCVDPTQFRICFYDIETQTSCAADRNSIVKVKRIADNVELEGVLNELDDFIHTNDYLWWDETQQKYVKFNESCFFDQSFPSPSEAKFPVNVLTCYSTIDNKSYTWGIFPYTGNAPEVTNYRYFKDEYEMFTDFVKWFASQKFDFFSGWNSDGFDLEYIVTRIRRLEDQRGISTTTTNFKGEQVKRYKLTKLLSPLRKDVKLRQIVDKKGKKIKTAITIPGMYTCDYMEVTKKFIYLKLPSFALNYVANVLIGEGKLEYVGQIYETYKRDWNRYVEYNVQDVRLLKRLEDVKGIFRIMIPYCIDCMITMDKYNSMIAAVEGYALKFLHNRNIVLNDRGSLHNNVDWWHRSGMFKVTDKYGNITYQNCETEHNLYDFDDFVVKAGYCYADPGRYKWVMSADIQSSYPHHIMMYNISPEVKVIKPTKEQIESGEVIESDINGLGFRRTKNAVLPNIIEHVFNERMEAKTLLKKYKREGNKVKESFYDIKQLSKKLIINSCYGVCLNENFHLYDIDCARAITRGGRNTIRYLRDCTDKYYTSRQMLKDAKKYFPTIKLVVDGKEYYYKETDEIVISRNNREMKILAKDFNERTDQLGVDE